MAQPVALLARLDAILAELQAIRAELVCTTVVQSLPDDQFDIIKLKSADDLAEANLLDTHSAQERFGYPQDTIRKWCRTENLGVMRGGRWMVSIPRLPAQREVLRRQE